MDSSWPERPAGTVDWEAVFEDDTSGLLPLISEARTPKALRRSAILIIEKLYTRDEDPTEVEHFTRELSALIPDDLAVDHLPEIVTTVTGLLRQLKEYRIKNADEHERQLETSKNGESSSAKVRRRSDNPVTEQTAKPVLKSVAKKSNRKNIYAGLSAAVVVIGIAIFNFTSDEKAPEKADPVKTLVQQIKAAASDGEPPDKHIFGGALKLGFNAGKPMVTAEAVPQYACSDVAWGLVNRGTVIINGRYSRKLSPKIIRLLCARKGASADIIFVPKK